MRFIYCCVQLDICDEYELQQNIIVYYYDYHSLCYLGILINLKFNNVLIRWKELGQC